MFSLTAIYASRLKTTVNSLIFIEIVEIRVNIIRSLIFVVFALVVVVWCICVYV